MTSKLFKISCSTRWVETILGCLLFIGSSILLHGNLDPASESRIEQILSQMTLEEKVAMCHAQSKFSSAGVSRLGIPEIWMSDGPHGVRAEVEWDSWKDAGWTNDACTAFPALTSLASTFNPDNARQYGVALGEEARYRRKDVMLGPGVNIYRTPFNGRNFEYMGEDPFLAARMAVPYIQGVQSNGVAACVKHFVLNNQEIDRGVIDVEVSDRALHEIYLPAFKAAVVEGDVWSLMGAYNQYRGEHCCHNNVLLNDILEGDWNFDGVVISDWNGVHDTEQAAYNGLDIEMGTGTNGLDYSEVNAYENYFLAQHFLGKLKDGEIPEAVVDGKVRRILRLLFRTTMNRDRPFGRMSCVDHSDVARKIARDGMVLLRNEDRFFPIDPEKPMTLAVIGENGTRWMSKGGGSSKLKAKYEITPLEGIQKRFKNAKILYASGYTSKESGSGSLSTGISEDRMLQKEAIEAARKADLVLFVGGLNKDPLQDCEGADRIHYHLPYGQDELIRKLLEVNDNLGVLLVSGNAVEMPWVDEVKAIMQVWYSGSEGGHAIADLLSGDSSPSGKLPFTFPRQIEDSPAHAFGAMSYPGDGKNQIYKEGIFVGYRWYEKQEIEPLFPFGYGLSYTTFEIRDIRVDNARLKENDTCRIQCSVTNSGKCAGAEVVQVYVSKADSEVERAPKELKGFCKVELQPGDSSVVEIPVKVNDLAYWDESTASWSIEKGSYTISVGNASNNLSGSVKIEVE